MQGIGGDYNPWRIRGAQLDLKKREQRQRQEEQSKKKGQKHKQKERQEDVSSLVTLLQAQRPEAKHGLIWDALLYLHEARGTLLQVRGKFDRFCEPIVQACDTTKSDTERKLFQRQYQAGKSKYNEELMHLSVQGEPLFTGLYHKSPKDFGLKLPDHRPFELFVPPMDARNLEMAHLRIDSFVSARRADKRMKDALQVFDKLGEYLRGRESVLKIIASEARMLIPNFEELAAQQRQLSEQNLQDQTYSRSLAGGAESTPLHDPAFEYLRFEQEQVAAKKGRKKALLISTKA